MMELFLQKYEAVKYIHKKASSQLLALILNMPLIFGLFKRFNSLKYFAL